MSMTIQLECPQDYKDCNPENTQCSKCGSRIHFIAIGEDNTTLRCSWCGSKIDDVHPEIARLLP